MPVYDYVCSSCRHRFEVFRGLNEAGPHQCPLCEGPVARAFVPPTIHFKGTGWAKKDRRSPDAPTKKAGAGDSTGGDSKPTSSGSGDSKSGESKAGESKAGESKPTSSGSGESKSGESKSGESKAGESKPTSSGSGD
ncbi:MAG: zinc ribbon domain-containing protein [Chloroflexota bacterium]